MDIPNDVHTGLIESPPQELDWIAGGETGMAYEIRNPSGIWDAYLPDDERQNSVYFDTMACVSFSALNSVETQVNFLIQNKMLRLETLQALEALGFLKDGRFNCSDRFTAKMSGTTRNGNYFVNVWGSICNHGLLPESDWAYPREQRQPVFVWDDYYQEIPQTLKDKAKKFLELFSVEYEWVAYETNGVTPSAEMKKHLLHAPVQIGAPMCAGWNSGNVPRCGSVRASHATMVYGFGSMIQDLDHYAPYKKVLVADYPVIFAIKGVVRERVAMTPPPKTTDPAQSPAPKKASFTRDMVYGERSENVRALQDLLKRDGCMSQKVQSTGYYGPITKAAVRAFQTKYAVASPSELRTIDGRRVGPKTRQKLNEL